MLTKDDGLIRAFENSVFSFVTGFVTLVMGNISTVDILKFINKLEIQLFSRKKMSQIYFSQYNQIEEFKE